MPKKTCPLCGGKLKNNYCESCGYDVPDDGDLSALYDMDPENDAFGEVVREITPDVQAEEIYPNRPAGLDTAYEQYQQYQQPKFKVRDSGGNTVHQNQYGQQSPPPPSAQQNVQNGQNGQNANPYAGYGPYGGYGGNGGAQNNGGNASPPPSPYANRGGQNRQNKQPVRYANTGDFIKAYWWLLLISFLVPIAGIAILISIKKAIDQKYIGIVISVIVLGFILPP